MLLTHETRPQFRNKHKNKQHILDKSIFLITSEKH